MKVLVSIFNVVINILVAIIFTCLVGFILFIAGTAGSRFANAYEDRVKIAVIDTGAPTDMGNMICSDSEDLTGMGIEDKDGHGKNIAHILAQDLDSTHYCLLILKWYHSDKYHTKDVGKALELAVARGASYINMSLEGEGKSGFEEYAIKVAVRQGVVVAVAAGNDDKDLYKECDIYPACYNIVSKNFYVVANFFQPFVRYPGSNYGGPVNAYESGIAINAGGYIMTGTSQATAVFLNKKIRGLIRN